MSAETEAAMQNVFKKVKEVHDLVPRRITEILELISHEDVIETTQDWLAAEEREHISKVEREDSCNSIGGYDGCS